MDLTSLLYLVPLVGGVTEVAKRSGLSTNYVPLFALVLGALLGFSIVGMSTVGILSGVVAALSTMGLYSGAKTTVS